MRDLYIVGAGGLGRQIAWIVSRINERKEEWNLCGFIDDDKVGTVVNNLPVVSDIDTFIRTEKEVWCVCALGSSSTRKKVVERLEEATNIHFATLIDPSVIISPFVTIGEGTMICAGSIVTVNIEIGRHVLVNWDCTVGHDSVIGDYCTISPSANICGNVHIGNCTEIGVGAQVIQNKSVAADSIVGGGAVVVRNIDKSGTYVGVPAKLVGGGQSSN